MISTRLILAEGLPGQGKSTTGQFIGLQLQRNGIEAEWYNEGDMNHPVDFQFDAGFSEDRFKALLKKYSDLSEILSNETEIINEKYYIRYVNLSKKYAGMIPDEFFRECEANDLYFVPEGNIERYTEFAADKWKRFVLDALNSDKVYVFESSFLQNPFNSLVWAGASEVDILKHTDTLMKIIEPLNPVLIYFYKEDIQGLLKRTCKFKGEEWAEKVSKNIAVSSYGKARNLNGFEGMLEYFTYRYKLERNSCESFNSYKILVETTDWDWKTYYRQILDLLQIEHIGDLKLPIGRMEAFAGSYRNDETKVVLSFYMENGRLFEQTFHFPLVPKDDCTFYLSTLSSELTFNIDEAGSVNSFTVGGRATEFFFDPGTIFEKVPG